MQHVILLLIISFTISCKDDEPKGEFCTYISGEQVHCFPTDKDKPEFVRDIAIGDYVVTPDFFAEIKKHHKDLHIELEAK